jgi:hypothetical protein
VANNFAAAPQQSPGTDYPADTLAIFQPLWTAALATDFSTGI